jgi:hypothetical protein
MTIRFSRWRRRLLGLAARTAPIENPARSTLEAFFAEIRWQEQVGREGERTLRPTAL